MIYVGRNAKPGAGTPGFARLLCTAFASLHYCIGSADANAYMSFLPVAISGAGRGAALLRGAVS